MSTAHKERWPARGPAFRDNRVQGAFILRQDGGIWKRYDQEIHNVGYLEQARQ